jgi:predicted ATPase/transcriptional regulator with XRE-family HTH domain
LGENDAAAVTTFGALLRRYRLAAGLTQESLAEKASLGIRSIQDLESGLHRPRHESVQQLVRALALAGNQRTQFEAAGQPAPRRRTELASASATIPAPPRQVRRTNLPTPWTSFVGRDQELLEVQELLRGTPLLTLSGPGGCGKTRLAVQLGHVVRDDYPDGVWLADLAPLADPALVAYTVATVLDVVLGPAETILATLAAAVGSKRLLLILDNCEHLIQACAELAEQILHAAPKVRILATSREPLRADGETVYRVPSLATPPVEQNLTVDAASQYGAVRLFVDRARSVRPSFALSAANVAAVAQICVRLDGIPLALELAAARVGSLPVEQIAGRMSDRFRLLTAGRRTSLPRQQTLQATVDWSHDLLAEREQILFRRLAVFAGGWTLDAAEAVCSERIEFGGSGVSGPIPREAVLDLLLGLVDKSLVLVEEHDGEVRYRLLETLRQYAHERLLQSGQEDDLKEAHAAFFLTVAEQKAADDWGGQDQSYYDQLEVEHDNLRAALQWFADRGDLGRGLQLSSTLVGFWFVRGHVAEGQRWLDCHLRRSEGASSVPRAMGLEMAGLLAYSRGDLDVAAAFARQSVAMFRELGDRRRGANCLNLLGIIARNQCSYSEAVAALEEGLQIHREYDDQFYIAQDLFQLGAVARQQSELARARSLLEDSLSIQRMIGPPRSVGIVLFHLGLVAANEGDDAGAQSLYEQSVALMRQVKDKFHQAFLLEAFANLSVGQGRLRRGAHLSGAADALRQQIGSTVPPWAQPGLDRTLRLAREGLGEDAFGQAWAEGKAMTLEQAISYALEDESA